MRVCEFYVGFVSFEVSLMWYVYVWSQLLIFGLEEKKNSGDFDHENEGHRVRFFNVLKFELIALDVLNIFYDYDKIQI